jgi:hypothetical protein
MQGGGQMGNQAQTTAQQRQLVLEKAKKEEQEADIEIEGKSKGKIDWLKLKHDILNGIIDEPVWRLDLRSVIIKFKNLMSQQHPGWRQILQNPWYKKGIPYLSSRTGTCRPKKKKGLPKSTSLPNLKEFYRHEKDYLEYNQWVDAKQHEEVDDMGKIISNHEPNPLRARVRANSYNAQYDLIEIQAIIDEPANDINQMHIEDDAKELDIQEEDLDFTIPDQEYYKSVMTPEAHEAIMKLLQRQRVQGVQKEDDKKNIADDKDSFNLQEVMELTLLHAQQLHVMKEDYEYVCFFLSI